MDYMSFLYIMAATVFYAMFYYLSYKISDVNNLDWTLLLSTLIIGVGIGIVQAATGIIPTFEDVKAELAIYAVFIGVADQLIHQILYRFYPDWKLELKTNRMKSG